MEATSECPRSHRRLHLTGQMSPCNMQQHGSWTGKLLPFFKPFCRCHRPRSWKCRIGAQIVIVSVCTFSRHIFIPCCWSLLLLLYISYYKLLKVSSHCKTITSVTVILASWVYLTKSLYQRVVSESHSELGWRDERTPASDVTLCRSTPSLDVSCYQHCIYTRAVHVHVHITGVFSPAGGCSEQAQ